MLLRMRRMLVVALVASAGVLMSGPPAGACAAVAVQLEDAIDPSHDVGARAVGVVERRTVEAAPYLGVSGPRSISAVVRSWGQLPADMSPRVDESNCGVSPLPRNTVTYFVVFDDGATKRVYPGESGGSQSLSDTIESAIVDRFGEPAVHHVGLGTTARVVAALWLVPLVVAIAVLAGAALVDRRRGGTSSPRSDLAVITLGVAAVLGVALSFPDPGWATVRFVAGYLALAGLSLWAASRGTVTTVVLIVGTVLFAAGSGTLGSRAHAAATSAFGIALLVEGLAVHSTAPDRGVLRFGHLAVVVGAALVAGSIWVRGTLGGDNGTITLAVVAAVAAAVLWSWHVEARHTIPAARMHQPE